MTRFLIINKSEVFGGQERYLEILAAVLIKSYGCEVRLEGGPARIFECAGINLALASKGRLADVVVLNGNRALYTHVLRRSCGRARVYIQHSAFQDLQAGRVRRVVRSILMRIALTRVDSVIRVCDSALPARLIRNRSITTVHNGVKLDEFPYKGERTIVGRPIRLLMVGAVNPNKNQQMAIEALVHLPMGELTIVGDGPSMEGLKARAAELGVDERVIWAGRQEDTARFYREADIYLMLSRFEAMPFVVLESMASGTPVFALKVGGVPEVITDEVDGVLLPDGQVQTLVSALERVCSASERLREMGRNARSTIEKRFTAEHMVEGFLRVVEEVRRRKGIGQTQ